MFIEQQQLYLISCHSDRSNPNTKNKKNNNTYTLCRKSAVQQHAHCTTK